MVFEAKGLAPVVVAVQVLDVAIAAAPVIVIPIAVALIHAAAEPVLANGDSRASDVANTNPGHEWRTGGEHHDSR